MAIELETLNKIAVRLQQKESVTDIEKDMLIGLLNSCLLYTSDAADE